MSPNKLNWPLMANNISRKDLNELIAYLSQEDPRLTQSDNVKLFEQEWSQWLGVKYSVFVNSGSSANLLTIAALKEIGGTGEIIVPPLTWVSDIAAVIHCGFTPVFADINLRTLGMSGEKIIDKITSETKAIFLTHVLGFNALTHKLLDVLNENKIPLIEDVCESHGAIFEGKKLGTFGLMSNFSFYYAHHMSTIEGGMISTNDDQLYQILRMFRSHGLVREASSKIYQKSFYQRYPDLNPEFIFAFPAYNVRSTELNAVIGRTQLKRLDHNNETRRANFKLFLQNLDSDKYFTDFALEGSCNYAFTLVLKQADDQLCVQVMKTLDLLNVEFRRGTAGGGNQLRQPYLKQLNGNNSLQDFPSVEHVHFYGFYIGNYPALDTKKIFTLCNHLNQLEVNL